MKAAPEVPLSTVRETIDTWPQRLQPCIDVFINEMHIDFVFSVLIPEICLTDKTSSYTTYKEAITTSCPTGEVDQKCGETFSPTGPVRIKWLHT